MFVSVGRTFGVLRKRFSPRIPADGLQQLPPSPSASAHFAADVAEDAVEEYVDDFEDEVMAATVGGDDLAVKVTVTELSSEKHTAAAWSGPAAEPEIEIAEVLMLGSESMERRAPAGAQDGEEEVEEETYAEDFEPWATSTATPPAAAATRAEAEIEDDAVAVPTVRLAEARLEARGAAGVGAVDDLACGEETIGEDEVEAVRGEKSNRGQPWRVSDSAIVCLRK